MDGVTKIYTHIPGLLTGLELEVRKQKVTLDIKEGDSEREKLTSWKERLV